MATSIVAYGAMSFKYIESLCEILYIPAVIVTVVTGLWIYLNNCKFKFLCISIKLQQEDFH